VTQPPESPPPPRAEQITTWVESLGSDEVLELAQSVASGNLGRRSCERTGRVTYPRTHTSAV
jgi:hypothetical protein